MSIMGIRGRNVALKMNERAGKRLCRLPARIAWGRPFPNQSCGSLQSPSGGSLSARDNSNKISNGRDTVN